MVKSVRAARVGSCMHTISNLSGADAMPSCGEVGSSVLESVADLGMHNSSFSDAIAL